ncbi:TonB-dependent receptor [Niabella insulamsoli]|uniref:SusC/RagA family TonB-linked outer membrane protein n=1 Tax=Niabella insulamsoli TaxID=3144874 RepID=UPI0031FC82C8
MLLFQNCVTKRTAKFLLSILCLCLLAGADVNARPKVSVAVLQQTQVNGTVLNEAGEPVQGASVFVKGTSVGATTDQNGAFSINAKVGDLLEISSVGYQSFTYEITNADNISITLRREDGSLEELVVVGYGKKEKANLTGAVTSVNMDKVLGDRPVSDGAKALQGSIPGLQIAYGSGQPGGTTSINIRGFESINGTNNPLILVNNVPMDINDINPKDIETVTVLKDASSASIYGARAAFGVILITTKSGAKNTPVRFNYATTMGYNKPTTLPEKASPKEFVQALLDWGQATYYTGENTQQWMDFINEYNANPAAYPEGYILGQNDFKYFVRENDIYGEFINNKGFNQLHNLSVSGGSEKTFYRLSLGMTDEDGIMAGKNDTYRRYNANLNLTSELSKKLSTNFNIFYKNGLRKVPVSGDINTLYYSGINFHSALPTGYTEYNGEQVPYSTPANIVLLSPPRKNYDEVIRLFGKATYKPIDKVDLNAEYTFEKTNTKFEDPSYTPAFISPTTQVYTAYNALQSAYSQGSSEKNYLALNLYGNYNETIGKHKMGVLLGMNQETSQSKGFSANRQVLISPTVPGLSTATGNITVGDSYSDFGVIGFFGRLNYTFDNKYLLEVNGRYDGSSRFPKGDRFGFFPSISGGWKIGNENFMKGLKPVLSDLKLRASYGEIGNQILKDGAGNFINYPYLPDMNAYNAAWINASTGALAVSLTPPEIVSSSFTWERVRTTNLGLDFSLFKNKLSAELDWYNRQTLDMLAPGAELPATLGGPAPRANVADLSTKGWEANLTWKDQINEFNYSLGFNLYDNKTKITRFNNEGGLLGQYYVGQVNDEIWGYTTAGYYTVDDFVEGTLNENLTGGTLKPGVPVFKGFSPNPGDIKFADLNGDGEIFSGNNTLTDPGDRSIIGNSNRRFQFGFNTYFSYKGFDLSLFLQGVLKRDLWISHPVVFPYTFEFTTVYAHQLDYWTPSNTDAFYPRNYPNGSGNYGGNIRVQTKYLQNGAYARLKNITAGYTLPPQLLNKMKIQNLRIFVTGENLFNWDHLPDGLDAELTNINNGGNYPFLKNLSAGLNLTF